MISSTTNNVTLAPDDVNVDVDYTYAADAAGLMFNVEAVLGGSADGWKVEETADTDSIVTLPDPTTAGDGETLAITIKENNTLGQRTATLTFTTTGGTGPDGTQVLKITQSAGAHMIAIANVATRTLDPTGGTEDIVITSNSDWRVTTSDIILVSSITLTSSGTPITPSGGSITLDGEGDGTITITYLENRTNASQSGEIKLEALDSTNNPLTENPSPIMVALTQGVAPPTLMISSTTNNVTLAPDDVNVDVDYTYAADAAGLMFNVEAVLGGSADGWKVEETADTDGIVTLPDPTTAGDGETLAITIKENMTIKVRTATLTFTTTGGTGIADTQVLKITQSAGAHMIAIANVATRTLDPTGGTEDIVITSNSDWRVTTSDIILVSSITLTSSGTPITPSGGSITLDGEGDGTITITYLENRTNASQSGEIKLEALDSTNNPLTENPSPIMVALTQGVAPPTLMISSTTNNVTLAPDDVNVDVDYTYAADAAGLMFNVEAVLGGSADGWKVEETADTDSIVTLPDPTTAGDGETLAITIKENNTLGQRTATLTFTTTGGTGIADTQVLKITQSARAHMIAIANVATRTLDPTGGTEDIVITSNSDWRVTTSDIILVSSITLTSSGTPITPSGGSITLDGEGDGTITITYLENRTNASQSGEIKLEALDSTNNPLTENPSPIMVALTQGVAPPTLMISSTTNNVTLAPDDVNVDVDYTYAADAAGLMFNVEAVLGGSADGWKVEETADTDSIVTLPDPTTAGMARP